MAGIARSGFPSCRRGWDDRIKPVTEDTSCRVFLISPIGAEGSEVRKKADQAQNHLVRAALPSPKFQVDRADEDSNPGSITPRMIDAITSADLVVIDLTGHNPNVFYETAIAHGYRKPCVHIITEGEAVPFDVKDLRVVHYLLSDPDKLQAAVRRLSASADSALSGGTVTPLSAASEFKQVESSTNPFVSALANLSDRLERLEALLRKNASGLSPSLESYRSRRAYLEPEPVTDPYDARRRVDAMISSVTTLIQRDPDQEVRGIALDVVDTAITAVKTAKPDDPVVAATASKYWDDAIGSGKGLRAADLLVVAEQLAAALGPGPLGGFA
jgi:hypothetical protein